MLHRRGFADCLRIDRPTGAFYLHDDVQAVVETLTTETNARHPRELADYAKAFEGPARMAVYGDAARDLIHAAPCAGAGVMSHVDPLELWRSPDDQQIPG